MLTKIFEFLLAFSEVMFMHLHINFSFFCFFVAQSFFGCFVVCYFGVLLCLFGVFLEGALFICFNSIWYVLRLKELFSLFSDVCSATEKL